MPSSRSVNFGSIELDFLAKQLLAGGIDVDPTKVDAITKWNLSANFCEFLNFLGLGYYYWRFVKDLCKVTGLMTRLTRNGVNFLCSDKREQNFQELK